MTVVGEVTQRDLRSRSREIMDAVEHGESFTVTRSGNPIGELVPIRPRRAVSREAFAAASANAPVVDAERFRDDVDASIDTELHDPYEH